MACRAAFGFERSMFKDKRTLFIRVAFYTSRVRADREVCLFLFKTAVSVMTIAAIHRAFENLMMIRLAELRFHFRMTSDAKLRLALSEHCKRRIARSFFGCFARQRNRAGFKGGELLSVRRMTLR